MRKMSQGFTAMELLTAMSVATVMTTIGFPSMSSMVTKSRLESAATEVHMNLLQARSQAIKQNRNAFVSVTGSAGTWRYGLDDTARCNASTSGDCTVNGVERVFSSSDWRGVSLTQNFANDSVAFEPRRGMAVSSGTITLTSAAGEVRVNVSPIGHVSLCSPAGAQQLRRYPSC